MIIGLALLHRTALNMNIEQFVLFVILICKKITVNLISFCFAFGCFLQVFCCYVSQCHYVTLPNQLVYFVVFFQHYLEVQEHANKALKLKVCVCTCVFVKSAFLFPEWHQLYCVCLPAYM